MQDQDKLLFQRQIPEFGVDYCYQLWKTFDFKLKISKKRNSKLGDYRYDPSTKSHAISVNHNLNKYAFAITYIHEVAHLITQIEQGRGVLPHGIQWKQNFKKLMLPLLNEKMFPMDILSPLALHMKNPKATSTADERLFKALKKYDDTSEILLSEIDSGGKFLFNKKVYRKIEVRRTRSLCLQLETNRQYLISETAPIHAFKND